VIVTSGKNDEAEEYSRDKRIQLFPFEFLSSFFSMRQKIATENQA